MSEKTVFRSVPSKPEFGFINTLLTAFAVTIPALFILAAVLTFTDFPEKYKSATVLITTVTALFVAGFRAGMNNEKSGAVKGALSGLAYMLILYLASSIAFNDFMINQRTVIMIITGVIAGAAGGIAGINRKSRPSKKVTPLGKKNDILKKYRR